MLGSQEVRELLAQESRSVAVRWEESVEGRDGADGERFFYSSQAKTLLILKTRLDCFIDEVCLVCRGH